MMKLSPLYFARLQLDPTTLDEEPTLDKLGRLVQAHLEQIPFENLAQHGAVGGLPTLDMAVTAHKVLTRKRGGFCMELNGLFAEFLKELGYQVTLLPAHVFVGNGYIPVASHVVLIVKTQDDDDDEANSKWFVDVGFGEPALRPLRYELDTAQQTPEGMISRFVMLDEQGLEQPEQTENSPTNQQDSVRLVGLQWKTENGWMPRLKWNESDALLLPDDGPTMEYFAPALDNTLEKTSVFSQKLICCRLTKDEKITLAGNILKKTGPPRFVVDKDDHDHDDSSSAVPKTTTELTSVQEVREILQSLFGIPLEESKGLDLSRSLHADPVIWAHM